MLDRITGKIANKLTGDDLYDLEIRYRPINTTVTILIGEKELFKGDVEGAIAFASSYQPIEPTPKKRGKDGRFAPKANNAVGDRVVRMDS